MKKIKDLIYKIKESTRLQLIVGAISVGLIATGVIGVIAYKNSNNSLASSGEVEEANESEADIILTENESESGELVATDKEGNVVASGEEVEKLVEEKKSKGETVVAKTEDGTTVKVDKVDGDKVTSSGGQTVKPSPKPPVIADNNTNTSKPEDNSSNNGSNTKPGGSGDSNSGGSTTKPSEPTKPVEPSKPSKPEKPTEPSKPVEPEKPSYPAKGFDKATTDKFNARMLDQGFAYDDSYSGVAAYTAIKNYAINRTPIPTSKLVIDKWGCKATGKVLTFTDTFSYTNNHEGDWSRSLTSGKLMGCGHNYFSILANYAVCNSNGDGTFTVTVYALDMTDL